MYASATQEIWGPLTHVSPSEQSSFVGSCRLTWTDRLVDQRQAVGGQNPRDIVADIAEAKRSDGADAENSRDQQDIRTSIKLLSS